MRRSEPYEPVATSYLTSRPPALPLPRTPTNACKPLILDLNGILSATRPPLHIHPNSPNTKPKYLPPNNHGLNPDSNDATASPGATSTHPPTPVHIVRLPLPTRCLRVAGRDGVQQGAAARYGWEAF
jgi:hypothetical protein